MYIKPPNKLKIELQDEKRYKILITIVDFFKLIGMGTCGVSRDTLLISKKPNWTPLFSKSQIGVAYNFCFVIFLLCMSFFAIPYKYNHHYKNKTVVTQLMEAGLGVCGVATSCLITMLFTLKQGDYCDLLNGIVSIKRDLSSMTNLAGPLLSMNQFAVLCLANNALLWLIIIYSDIELFDDVTVIRWFSVLIPHCLLTWFVMQYFLLVTLVTEVFVKINRGLVYLSELQNFHNSFVLSELDYSNNRETDEPSDKPLTYLVKIRGSHASLCEITGLLSEFYALPALFTVAILFVASVYNAYYIVHPLVRDQELGTAAIVNCITWIVAMNLPIVLLTSYTGKVTKEVYIIHTKFYSF